LSDAVTTQTLFFNKLHFFDIFFFEKTGLLFLLINDGIYVSLHKVISNGTLAHHLNKPGDAFSGSGPVY
jgi:hypothetical protein